jgi:hypothetical protein
MKIVVIYSTNHKKINKLVGKIKWYIQYSELRRVNSTETWEGGRGE